MTSQRRLAAIMFTDIVGYSALAQINEALALELVETKHQLLRPLFVQHHGREIKTMGDGLLVEFASALQAVQCAISAQRTLKDHNASQSTERAIAVRIGIHLGDVEHRKGDIYGDGVNIAARIEPLADPGGICISEDVARQVQNKITEPLQSLGKRQLKNIQQAVEVYRIVVRATADVETEPTSKADGNALKSLAVLPFIDLSPDRDNEYFSDGITEELIDAFAKIDDLKVIARTSVFALKGKNLDVRAIGDQLNVQTVLEGSVRKAGERLRITAQLIEVSDQTHLWSERYDRDMGDVFAIQEDIAKAIVGTLESRFKRQLLPSLAQQCKCNPEAYDAYLQGRYFTNRFSEENLHKAVALFEKSVAIDPTYAAAHAGLAEACQLIAGMYGHRQEMLLRARAAAERALALDDRSAEAHFAMAGINHWHDWDFVRAESEYTRALALNPGSAEMREGYAVLLVATGRLAEAIEEIQKAHGLDPLSLPVNRRLGVIYGFAGRYAQAHVALARTLELDPHFPLTYIWIGAIYLKQGRDQEALAAFEKESEPLFRNTGLAMAHARLGRQPQADEALKTLIDEFASEATYQIAEVYAQWGDLDRAFEWLQLAYEQRDPGLSILRADFLLEPVRGDARYTEMLAKMGLDH